MEHRKTGVLTREQVERLPKKGKVAIIECVEDIPCDPCVTACPSHAIVMDTLIGVPVLAAEKCGGCGACIAECPGLAIFVVDFDYAPDKAVVMLPFEFVPLPKKGEEVYVLDREGTTCGKGHILRVTTYKNKTSVISVVVPKDLAMQVRNVRRIP